MVLKKIFLLSMGFSLLFLSACATPYVITLRDGTKIQTEDKPDFDDDDKFYSYQERDTKKESRINKDEVVSIQAVK